LRKLVGRDTITLPDPRDPIHSKTIDCRLTVDNINDHSVSKTQDATQMLARTLRTIVAATVNQPIIKTLDTVTLPVHNPEIAALLKGKYTTEEFKKLFDFCVAKGVFTPIMLKDKAGNESGFIKTTAIDDAENLNMVRQWVTDSVRNNAQMIAINRPDLYRKCLDNLAQFYNQSDEVKVLNRIISDELDYRNTSDANYLKNGVAHIFDPATLQHRGWNMERIENRRFVFRIHILSPVIYPLHG
jgi:vacuolar-type H+-ATPase subunit C/Vma6